MKRYGIRVEPHAEREIDQELRWWEERDPSRALAIVEELEKAYRRLARLPESGALIHVRGTWSKAVRFLVLSRIGYLLYYEVEHATRRIFVLSLWHEKRRPLNLRAWLRGR